MRRLKRNKRGWNRRNWSGKWNCVVGTGLGDGEVKLFTASKGNVALVSRHGIDANVGVGMVGSLTV